VTNDPFREILVRYNADMASHAGEAEAPRTCPVTPWEREMGNYVDAIWDIMEDALNHYHSDSGEGLSVAVRAIAQEAYSEHEWQEAARVIIGDILSVPSDDVMCFAIVEAIAALPKPVKGGEA
jgi:hypothetical protein